MGTEVVEHCYQIAQAAAQPVEFRGDKRVTGPKRPEATKQGRARGVRVGQSLIAADVRAPGAFERPATVAMPASESTSLLAVISSREMRFMITLQYL